ncbi:DUF3256 family protein [uncultured Bacteroides sp.]|uniref:DUF3256 family protein n=1 Tax=uncultured Bacteroides sp. TaxID=162156 RepID=UPI0023BEB338|nr:DUF3256 family protein [uncultured Bacteroides sp.]MDE5701875.1 DUF3256 family protein [Bacteroides sp.]MDE6172321.1 DUF3256 family protein [Bacteroides sp.]
MMKKLTMCLCLACIWMCSLQAQEAKTCFINMPDSLSPLLTSVNRADCIDFLESKMKAEVTNRFEGKSEMTALSSDYISMQVTSQSSWQMKLLATSDTTKLICVVSTACAPACDSSVRFYTTDWKELPASSYLTLPVSDDFLDLPDSLQSYEVRDAAEQADMLLMKAVLSAENDSLVFTFTTPDYMDKEAAAKLKPYLRRPVVYVWKGNGYERSASH